MGIAAVLSPDQLNRKGMVFIDYRVIKHQISIFCLVNLMDHVFPYQSRCDFLSSQISINLVVRKLLTVVGEVRYRVINLTDQQILAVV